LRAAKIKVLKSELIGSLSACGGMRWGYMKTKPNGSLMEKKENMMKTLRLAPVALLALMTPAFAGSMTFDLPNLTWPTETTTTSQSGQAVVAVCTEDSKPSSACDAAK